MWAAGRLEFPRTLRVGDTITRTSTIADVSMKEGRSGKLVFVRVTHEFDGPTSVAVREEQDIVYRGAPQPGEVPPAPRPAPAEAPWQRDIVPDPVLLFRYSALTFNAHRIHYDRTYATGAESYPGLVVHGPLMATLLVDLVRRNSVRRITGFQFRALAPVFDTAAFAACGRAEGDEAALWVRRDDGALAMEATATLED
jgi:3-methylfumaryl-CoA hydratase